LRNIDSKLKSSKQYSNKKNAGIAIVNNWLDLKRVKCPAKLKRLFNNSVKKDDLCDAMMIGVSWIEMIANSKRFIVKSRKSSECVA
jgi:hypothetical protein